MDIWSKARYLKKYRSNNYLTKMIIDLQHMGSLYLSVKDNDVYDIILDDGVLLHKIKLDFEECSCYCPISF